MSKPDPLIQKAMELAILEASQHIGATAPNPPVGAVAIDRSGRPLAVYAHLAAGTPHAEAGVIDICRKNGTLDQVATLIVTLEPCNHHGRTPPCCDAIIDSKIPKVVIGCLDPNPDVLGQGAKRLKQAGIQVEFIESQSPELHFQCKKLIQSWAYRVLNRKPFVVMKQALNHQGSMIPPAGQKTFTSNESLLLAHQLRKQSDAIITGIGTILSDWPLFTVRLVQDHPGIPGQKKRILVVMDRQNRVPPKWVDQAKQNGFEVWIRQDISTTLDELGQNGVNQVLVEAGPKLSQAFLNGRFCQKTVVIQSPKPSENEPLKDIVIENVYWNY